MLTAHYLRTLLITLGLKHVYSDTQQPICGGRVKGPVGTIQTPNFPNPFPVPIKCRWIIEHDVPNGTISVYFTQQYTTSGLTFTEYMYYDDSYKLGERRALTVTDDNITRIKYLQVQSPVLVVELSVSRAEGSQLRALGLLNVWGLNVTYAVRAPPSPATGPAPAPAPAPRASCSAIECRLLGHCYATHDYSDFFCSCFEGYSGPDCGVGPLCPTTSNMCKNKGTCRQMGPAAVSCICAPGYTGDLCESEIAEPECGIEECSEGCKPGTSCDCTPKDSDSLSARFETRLQVADMVNANSSEEVVKQVAKYLQASNITLHDEIEVLNVSSVDESGARSVWLRIWGARREAGAVRGALARLAASPPSAASPASPASPTTGLKLLPAALHFDMQPALSSHKLILNQHPEVWEGAEFILTCMAYGSSNIEFSWYKDGVKINFNGTSRDIWIRTVSEDALGRRMSVLGISEAKKLDSGKWACAARDAGRRRCSALRLTVFRPPNIRLMPSTLTVNKGDNVSITCLAGAGRMHGTLGFSWARERSLLALAPGKEVWEDLYPAGSVLKLYNVQKSSEYSCQVSSVAGTNSKAVRVWALGADDAACESGAAHGLRWPRTAPGARAAAACPAGYTGDTTRFCEPKTSALGVKWEQPNFSGCIDDSLQDIYEQFTRVSYGYSWQSVYDIVRQYGAILRSLPGHPGAATVPLQHATTILSYLRSPVANRTDALLSAEPLLKIYDTLLKYPDAFLDEQKINELQNAIVETATLKNGIDFRSKELIVQSKTLAEAHFTFPLSARSEEWLLSAIDVELTDGADNISLAVVNYNDLSSRLPSLRRSMEFKGREEMEYHMASTQSQVWADSDQYDDSQYTITLHFVHSKNYSAVESKLACAVRTRSEAGAWAAGACDVRAAQRGRVACRCRAPGTYALFTLARSTLTDAEKDLREVVDVTVGLGAALCLAAAAAALATLASGARPRLPALLRAATAAAHAAAGLALLQCDIRQEEACGGAAGWVAAGGWGAAGAALCAQPLALHADLAARPHAPSSVGILAGVCTLSWLTARLWGGAPLRLGSAAQLVCACGAALLAALCLCVCVCARLRLRLVARKVPAERRSYVDDRIRIVHHTLVLLVTGAAVQVAGVAYAQRAHPAALAAAALANGIAIFICYVIYDEECIRMARRMCLSKARRKRAGDTTLSLYIKHGGERESRGEMESSSPVTPLSTYWRFESPSKINRNLSPSQDGRADIIRCVEYKQHVSPPQYGRRVTTRAMCDLIPQPDYICGYVELGPINVNKTPTSPLLYNANTTQSCSYLNPKKTLTLPLLCDTNISKETCSLCVQSNPDVSKLPNKSCLKKTKVNASSVSLPSEETPNKPEISFVNKKWNKAYDPPDADLMIDKITDDLDFLLNRSKRKETLNHTEEAPT